LKIRFTTKAERQLASIIVYISRDNPVAAKRVTREILRAAQLLAEFPEGGRPGSVPSTREWVVGGLPDILVYRFSAALQELSVVAVIHGARRRSNR
jgi:plasmid stabilization system protein ParE